MNNDIERFSYGDWVQFDTPLKIYRDYFYPILNIYKWLGLESIKVTIPLYAKTIKVLKTFNIREGNEIFLLNSFGEFIDLPEKMEEGQMYYVNQMEKLILVSPEDAKKIRGGNFTEKDNKGIFCAVNIGERGCMPSESPKLKQLAYWTGDITQMEIAEQSKLVLAIHLQQLEFFNNEIEKKIQQVASTIIKSMSYPEAYKITEVNQQFIDSQCDVLYEKVENIYKEVKNYCSESRLETKEATFFNIKDALYDELKLRVGDYIDNNAGWLKDKAKGAVSTFFCGWTKLLDEGADVNAKNKYGRTALMWASWNGHTEIVKLLLDEGADVNAKDELGKTALMWASWDGHTEIVKLLIDKGADINAKNKHSETALMWASEKGHTETAKLLCK